MRAAAMAASHPAWPAPTTTTSNCSVNCIGSGRSQLQEILANRFFFHSSNLAEMCSASLADLLSGPYIGLSEILTEVQGGIMNISEFIEQLEARIAKYDLLCHPFYKAWSAGALTRDDLREYAQDYYHHVEAFPSYLEAFGMRLDEGELRRAVLANMCDE